MEESDEEAYSSSPKDGETRIKCRHKGCCAWKKTTFALANHMIKHRRGIRCQVCNRDFWQESALERHSAIHRKSEKYPKHLQKLKKGGDKTRANKDKEIGGKSLVLKLVRVEEDSEAMILFQMAQRAKKRKHEQANEAKETKEEPLKLKLPTLKLIRLEDDPVTRSLYRKAQIKKRRLERYPRHDKVSNGKNKSMDKQFKCTTCHLVFNNKLSRDSHESIVHSEAYSVLKDSIPLKHRMTSYGIGELNCRECGVKQKNRACLRSHLYSHLQNKFECPINGCSKKFSSFNTIRSHVKSAHEARKNRQTEVKKRRLNEKLRIEGSEGRHQCGTCKLTFKDRKKLNVHSFVHSDYYNSILDAIPLKFRISSYAKDVLKCKECGKCFKHRGLLSQHLFSHTVCGPIRCPNMGCSTTLNNLFNFKKHLYNCTMSENKPFPACNTSKTCKISGKFAEEPSSLNLHDRTRQFNATSKASADEEIAAKFQCGKCDLSFGASSDLKIHEEIHRRKIEIEKLTHPFKCRVCLKSFGLKWSLDMHMLTHIDETKLSKLTFGVELSGQHNIMTDDIMNDDNESNASYVPITNNQCDYMSSMDNEIHNQGSSQASDQINDDREETISNPIKERANGNKKRGNLVRLNNWALKCKKCGVKFKHKNKLDIHDIFMHNEKLNAIRDMIPPNLKISSYSNDLLKCKECGSNFNNRFTLKKHLTTHFKHYDMDCPITGCPRKFSNLTSIHTHLSLVHKGVQNIDPIRSNDLKCPHCKDSFTSSTKLRIHSYVHSKEYAKLKDAVPANLKIESYAKGVLKCRECGKIPKTRGKLQAHLYTHSYSSSIKCPNMECKKKLSNIAQLKNHLHSCNLNPTEEQPNSGNIVCSISPRTFSKTSNFKRHEKIHQQEVAEREKSQNEMHFKCKVCAKSFGLKWSLDLHEKTHDDTHKNFITTENAEDDQNKEETKTNIFQCGECGKPYTRKNNLTTHLKMHHNQFPANEEMVRCLICEKPFNKKNLQMHIKTHETNQRIKCHHEGCKSVLKHIYSLKYHLKRYHEDHQFDCRICGSKFLSNHSLQKHNSKHFVKNVTCKKFGCNTKFRSTQRMLTHFSNVHVVRSAAIHIRNKRGGFKCPFCETVTKNQLAFTGHVNVCKKRNSNGFYCNQENCVFWSNEFREFKHHYFSHVNLDIFLRRCPGEKNMYKTCPKCVKPYAKISYFLNHYTKSHRREFLFCNICTFSTPGFKVFELHYIGHMSDKCPIEQNPTYPINNNADSSNNEANSINDNQTQNNEGQYQSESSPNSIAGELDTSTEDSNGRLVFFINADNVVELRKLRKDENERMVRKIYCKKWRNELTKEYEKASVSETCLEVEEATVNYLIKHDLSRKKTKNFIMRGCSDKENQIKGFDINPDDSIELGLYAYGFTCAERLKFLVRRFLGAECSIQHFQSVEQFDEFLPYIEETLLDKTQELPTKSKESLESFILPETVKLAFMGSKQVGKTTLINQIMDGVFSADYEPTETPNQLSKKIYLEDRAVILNIRDTPGITPGALNELHADDDTIVVVVYDITSLDSFNDAEQIVDYLRRTLKHQKVVLVGNKIDKEDERTVDGLEAYGTGTVYNIPHIERTATAYWTALRLFWKLIEINTRQANGEYSIPGHLIQQAE